MARKPKGSKQPNSEKFKGPPVVCESLDQADSIFEEWLDLDNLEEQAKVTKAAAAKAANAAFKDALFVTYPEGKVPFEDRRLQFEAAIRAYAEAHRVQILLDGLKTRRLNFGELKWRETGDSIVNYAGVPEDGNQAILEELEQKARKGLAGYKGLSPAMLDCLTIDVAWSREALALALEQKRITKDDLRVIGFRLDESHDEFKCRPLASTGGSVESADE